MGRASPKEQRLRLFEKGNRHCPICLTPFTEPDVRAGEVVTLEHAPQQSVGGKPACLTCADCNTGKAEVIDRAVADYYRARDLGGYPVIVERDGRQLYNVHPKYYDIEKDRIRIRTRRDVVGKSLGPFTLRQTEPHPDAIRLGLLKSAYLMVFSLLGYPVGYRYALGEAVSSIREQLFFPEKELVRPLVVFTDGSPNPRLPQDAVLLVVEHQCWVVKIGTSLVVLPPGGSVDRYRKLAAALQPPLELGSTVRWPTLKFGDTNPFLGGKPGASKAEDLFGQPYPDQDHDDAVVVYADADLLAVLPASGP